MNKSLNHLLKNRKFLGSLIADPEGTMVKYNVKLKEPDLLRLYDIIDASYEAMQLKLKDGLVALLDCSNACPLNC